MRGPRPGEQRRQRRRRRHVAPADQREQQQHDARPPSPRAPGPAATPSSRSPSAARSGSCRAMVNTPHGLSLSAFTTTSASTASRMTMIASTATMREDAGDRPDLLLRHLAERLAVAPHRGEQDDEVLHRAAEHDADDDPDRAGQVAELRREHRADQRARRRRWPRSGGRTGPSAWSARSRGRWPAARPGVARRSLRPKTRSARKRL